MMHKWSLGGIILLLLIIQVPTILWIQFQTLKRPNGIRFISTQSTENPMMSAFQPITIVTSFFLIEQSKHTSQDYGEWIKNFLSHLQCPIVIYTNVKDYISQQISEEQQSNTVIINSSLSHLFISEKYSQIYQTHSEMDPERDIGSPQLYVIWSSKVHFMHQISNVLNPFNSTYFFWVDIGSFRNVGQSIDVLSSVWPDYTRVMHAFAECKPTNDNCVILGLIHDFDSNREAQHSAESDTKICPLFSDHVQAGFMAGTAESLHWFYDEYFVIHNAFVRENIFVGKEQNILNVLVLKNSGSERMLLLDSTFNTSAEYGWDQWFYFQFYFSHTALTLTAKPRIIPPLRLSQVIRDYRKIAQCRKVLTAAGIITTDVCEFHLYSAPNNHTFDMCLRQNGYISNMIKRFGTWKDCADLPFIFEHTLRYLKSEEATNYFLDIGGNIGACAFTMGAQTHLKNVKIISFEPLHSNQFYFRNTLLRNNFTNIALVNCGASNESEGTLKRIFVPETNAGGATIEYRNGSAEVFHSKAESVYSEQICVTTIDYIMSTKIVGDTNRDRAQIPLMKLDIEGFEYFALKGARKLLNDSLLAPWVIKFEYSPWHLRHKGLALTDLFALFGSFGYEIYSEFDVSAKKSEECFLCPFQNLVDSSNYNKITDVNYLNTLPTQWGMDLYAVRKINV